MVRLRCRDHRRMRLMENPMTRHAAEGQEMGGGHQQDGSELFFMSTFLQLFSLI